MQTIDQEDVVVEMVTVMSLINGGYGELVSPWGLISMVDSTFTTNAVKLFKGKGKGFG